MVTEYITKQIEFNKDDIIRMFGVNERFVRRVISDLRAQKTNPIVFIPVYKKDQSGVYKRIEHCTSEQIDRYIATQSASIKSHYFNTLKPLKNHMSDEHLAMLHGYQTIFEGDKNGIN